MSSTLNFLLRRAQYPSVLNASYAATSLAALSSMFSTPSHALVNLFIHTITQTEPELLSAKTISSTLTALSGIQGYTPSFQVLDFLGKRAYTLVEDLTTAQLISLLDALYRLQVPMDAKFIRKSSVRLEKLSAGFDESSILWMLGVIKQIKISLDAELLRSLLSRIKNFHLLDPSTVVELALSCRVLGKSVIQDLQYMLNIFSISLGSSQNKTLQPRHICSLLTLVGRHDLLLPSKIVIQLHEMFLFFCEVRSEEFSTSVPKYFFALALLRDQHLNFLKRETLVWLFEGSQKNRNISWS